MSSIFKKQNFFYIFLTLYFFVGFFLSITNGITSDEFHEQLNWEVNLSAIISFFKNGTYENLLNYGDRYHGIGFHLLSQPIQLIISNFVSNFNNIGFFGGYLISKHPVVFLLFSVSGIFFYLLCFKIGRNLNFAILSSVIYLLYPYLFGHAQFNPKDIPFLSIWLISSYFFLSIIENIFLDSKIRNIEILILSFLTAFLVSIRILGLIIFLEYLIGIIILFNIKTIDLRTFIKSFAFQFLFFLTTFVIFIYFLNPILWHSPFVELANSLKWMSKYHNEICTLTLGDCMNSLHLPSSYYFIWLFFKLPILIILGLFLFPFVEKKIFNDQITFIYYGTLLISLFLILFVFILINIAIYDEIRHIMFIVPIIIIIGLANLFYFNKFFFYLLSIFVIIFFVLENISLNPYQYTWMNSFAKFTNIQKNFEIDYWGVSNKNLNKKIIEHANKNNIDKNTCVFGDIYSKEFLIKSKFQCFKTYNKLDEAKIKPLYAYQNLRNVKRSNPKDCKLIWDETYRYTFSNKKISVGKLWFCN